MFLYNRMAFRRMLAVVIWMAAVALWTTEPLAASQDSVQVKLLAMMVPTVRANGSKGRAASMNAYFLVADHDAAVRLCKRSITIRDSLLEALYNKPVPRRADETVIMTGYNTLIKDTVNRSVPSAKVIRAHLAPGAASMGGAVIARLPFSSVNGCQQIIYGD